MAATTAAALPDDLIEEIFLRLPPDEPASLLRASLISKAWGGAISSPAFRRRLHEFHRTPPVLGFLHDWDDERIPRFVPTTASSFYLAAPDSRTWRALDYRHGRALFLSEDQGELLVWEPITGTQLRLPVPSLFGTLREYGEEVCSCAAVFCASDGCDHRDCHGDPFGLVFVFTTNSNMLEEEEEEGFDIWASVFSSETGGTWGELTLLGHSVSPLDFSCYSSVLVGRSLLYFMSVGDLILEYDLATESMTVLYKPSSVGRFNIMLTKDGGLGVGEYSNLNLKLWTREAGDNTDAHWVLSRVINLVNLLPIGALVDADSRVQVLGFAEGTNTIFLNTAAGIFKVELQAEKAQKVCDWHGLGNLIPVVTFFTPVPRGEHQDPPLLGPSEEAGGEQKLFDKGSNASEEGDFVNAGFSHSLKTRITSPGEIALTCASNALLYKGKAMNDPLDDVSKSASNEEFVTGTTSKDDAGNSKTSGSNVEDAAPPSQKCESKEGILCQCSFPWTSGGARAAPLCGEIHDSS